jgi:hypothetical protein
MGSIAFWNGSLYKHSLDRSIARPHIAGVDRKDRNNRITKMSTISLTTAAPASGLLGSVFAKVGAAFAARAASAAFAGMSEREYQDIGWGQPDRHPHLLTASETPPERRARATAVSAWYGRKAA